jgi:hypothetical protein
MTTAAGDFQADDEGSIPFTRSSFSDIRLGTFRQKLKRSFFRGGRRPRSGRGGRRFKSCHSDHLSKHPEKFRTVSRTETFSRRAWPPPDRTQGENRAANSSSLLIDFPEKDRRSSSAPAKVRDAISIHDALGAVGNHPPALLRDGSRRASGPLGTALDILAADDGGGR